MCPRPYTYALTTGSQTVLLKDVLANALEDSGHEHLVSLLDDKGLTVVGPDGEATILSLVFRASRILQDSWKEPTLQDTINSSEGASDLRAVSSYTRICTHAHTYTRTHAHRHRHGH